MKAHLTLVHNNGTPTPLPAAPVRTDADIVCYFTRPELKAMEQALWMCANAALAAGNQKAADAAADLAYRVARYQHPGWQP